METAVETERLVLHNDRLHKACLGRGYATEGARGLPTNEPVAFSTPAR